MICCCHSNLKIVAVVVVPVVAVVVAVAVDIVGFQQHFERTSEPRPRSTTHWRPEREQSRQSGLVPSTPASKSGAFRAAPGRLPPCRAAPKTGSTAAASTKSFAPNGGRRRRIAPGPPGRLPRPRRLVSTSGAKLRERQLDWMVLRMATVSVRKLLLVLAVGVGVGAVIYYS